MTPPAAGLRSLNHLGLGDLHLKSAPTCVLASVTKLVVHSVQNECHLPPTFPGLRALSCDAGDEGLSDIAVMVSGRPRQGGRPGQGQVVARVMVRVRPATFHW